LWSGLEQIDEDAGDIGAAAVMISGTQFVSYAEAKG
jgi:hypothetical protein